MQTYRILIVFITLFLLSLFVQAQDEGLPEFTDFRPEYRKWKDIYILDKIEYRRERMVIFFRFVDDNGGWATFYGPGKNFAWFLKDASSPTKVYPLLEIRNIRRNDSLKLEVLDSNNEVRYDTHPGDILTCEVHFNRLPITARRVDLIEGVGQEANENHFNCFEIKLKPSGSGALGTGKDMERRIKDFASPEKAEAVPELLEMVNQLRKKHGFCGSRRVPATPPIEWSEQLTEVAKKLVIHLWREEKLAIDRGRPELLAALAQEGHKTDLAYETLIFGADTPEEVFNNWKRMGAQCMRMRDGRVGLLGAARKGSYWILITAK